MHYKKIKSVIFDLSGTLIDYGSFAPVEAMTECFKSKKIDLKENEIRMFMGVSKIDHIRLMFTIEKVKEKWIDIYGDLPDDNEIYLLHNEFKQHINRLVKKYSDPIPDAVEIVRCLKNKSVKTGITTGYSAETLKAIIPDMLNAGFMIDSFVSPDEVPYGRPYPYMCYKSAINLNSFPLWHIVKVGDTVSDILEGLNAGMWTVGVIKGGNELGNYKCGTLESVESRIAEVRKKYFIHGAHYVIDDIYQLELILDHISRRLEDGELPVYENNHISGDADYSNSFDPHLAQRIM
jgi:phosphonoacetaldehyde hydrolase